MKEAVDSSSFMMGSRIHFSSIKVSLFTEAIIFISINSKFLFS